MPVMPYPKGVNARRLALLDKKYRQGGLSPDEQEELNGCARVMNAFLTQSPAMGERRDVLGEFEVFMDNMRRKALAKKGCEP